MSKEQRSAECDSDEQANESSRSLSQRADNTKNAELNLLSDTTLQDLPIEILELILIKAVVMEVKGLKLAKCAWKEKADPVMSRLKQVCSQWSNILATDHFPISLQRAIDDTAQDTIRLEVLQEFKVKREIHRMVTLKDEIFTLTRVRGQCYAINVYDRDNMKKAKDVIPLPRSNVMCMAACSASNCVYVGLGAQSHRTPLSVLRIWKDAEHKFNISPWKQQVYEPSIYMLSVSANGGLLTFSMGEARKPGVVAVHDENDFMELKVLLPRYIGAFLNVIQKSNGNLVVSYVDYQYFRTNLLEITTAGNIVREYESSLASKCHLNFADDYGRIMITETQSPRRMEILDSEFNLLGVYSLQQDEGMSFYMFIYDLKYDSERSVLLRSHYDFHTLKNVLTTFRFTEE